MAVYILGCFGFVCVAFLFVVMVCLCRMSARADAEMQRALRDEDRVA